MTLIREPGRQGGKARARNLSARERTRQARKAARARARKLSAKERSRQARKAARARSGKANRSAGKARMAAVTPEQRSALGKLAADAKKRRKLGGEKPKLSPAARRKLRALATE